MNTRFLDACWGKPVDRTPVWLMRQAGRYLPEYMAVRSKCTFLELCKTPELAAEVTIQPVDILGVDAAILFSDILTPVEPMGMKLDFVPGPVFENPIRSMADVEKLRIPQMEQDVPYVLETLKILRRELASKVPLIGFGGAPFHPGLLHGRGQGLQGLRPDQAHDVRRARCVCRPDGQDHHHEHGISQCPDQGRCPVHPDISTPGAASFRRPITSAMCLPYTTRLINGLNRMETPVIHFVKGAATMLPIVQKAGGDVMGLDWHVNLGQRP